MTAPGDKQGVRTRRSAAGSRKRAAAKQPKAVSDASADQAGESGSEQHQAAAKRDTASRPGAERPSNTSKAERLNVESDKKAAEPTVAADTRRQLVKTSKATKKAAKRVPLPGPEIKRAAKKAVKKATTQEKLDSAEQRPAPSDGRRPLDGIRILDLSRLLPGPYASHILASFGAEVIKVEKPGEGDYIRDSEPKAQGFNALFLTINRGKKSIAIDLKDSNGKEAFLALARKSDVVLDGFRPGAMTRLGLGYEQLKEVNPKLIYAALTGYGQTGRHANRAGHDLNYVAHAGMLDLLGESDGMPAVPGIQIADVAAGALPTVIGILLALQHRSRSHQGQLVDISMYDSILGLMPVQIANYTATKRRPKRGHERLFGRYACYNIYPVRNGRFLTVAALEPKFWRALCTALEREDLIPDQYVEGDQQQVLIAELTRIFQKKSVAEWMEVFGEADVCIAEVREISRSVQDDNLAERGIVLPVRGADGTVYEQLGVFPKLSDAPGYVSGDAPARGEHTRQILKSVNFTVKRINEMLAAKTAEEPPSSDLT